MDKINIFIIDDHKLFVEGISSLLADEEHFHVVGHACSGPEFLKLTNIENVDVYLVDINMPEISGVELTKKIKAIYPEAKVLALTMYDDFRYVEEMIRNGADGYILKSANLQELIHAIETVAKGSKYFGEKIQEIVYNKLSGKEKQDEIRHSPDTQVNLTRREIEILSLIAQEYTNPQIAEKLFISERTVETHRKNIFSKTKAKSIIGLSKYAIRHGLVNLE